MEWLTDSTDPQALLAGLHSAVRDWWQNKFADFSLPQRLAIPAIAAGKNVLVCAPTGTGKTLSAFIEILSDLLARAAGGTLTDAVDSVYISPLRALASDIRRNLLTPLGEIAGGTDPGATGAQHSPIRVGLRTGDSSAKDRAAMLKRPPHILVTTPESLALCLANPGMRRHLLACRRIVVDELHALAPNKRGTDLMLSVERLADLVLRHTGYDPQRIGLSATIAPLERMARYLVGNARDCAIADASFDRPAEIDIASVFGAGKTPFVTSAAINAGVYELLEQTIRQNRTTLVFTNVRSATERVTFALRKRFAAALERGEAHTEKIIHPEHIQAHHSSLDRDVRQEIERRLKAGELRCVVCSTSLELGIDIGTIDRVILLNSPKGVARGLQRIGRSGHHLGGTARGTLVPTLPADLLESLVTADAMRQRAVDEVNWPRGCLDVLAQHLIGMALQESPAGLSPEHAFDLVKRATPYADLTREQFDAVVRFVSTDDLRDSAFVPAKLTWQRRPADEGLPARQPSGSDIPYPPIVPQVENDKSNIEDPHTRLRPIKKSLSALYAQNVGTITQEGQVKVRLAGEGVLGTVEEAFAQMLKPGDRFVLGGRCLLFLSAKGMSIDVAVSTGLAPTLPRWFSGMLSMEPGLTARMRDFRTKVGVIARGSGGRNAIAHLLTRQYRASAPVAAVAAAYLHAQHRYAEIPTPAQLLVERVPDHSVEASPATVLVFHTMLGRAANDALARAVAYRISQRFGNSPPTPSSCPSDSPPTHRSSAIAHHAPAATTVVVDDYAFGIWLNATPAARRADRTLIRSLLSPVHFEKDLLAAVEASELFRSQFRYTAIRAHALLQNHFGRRRFLGQMQSYATRLYEALKTHHPDHLLLEETRRTVMQDVLAAPAAKAFLESLPTKPLRLLDLPTPSPFAFGLFTAAPRKRDHLKLADTADFLLAMYAKVQSRLTPEPEPVQAELF